MYGQLEEVDGISLHLVSVHSSICVNVVSVVIFHRSIVELEDGGGVCPHKYICILLHLKQ